MPDRITTGTAGLDEILHGGLPANGINLLMGLPGSGKTLLAQQCLFANANARRPAVYVSTASEPFEKILRYVQTLSFFDPTLVGNGVVYEELGTTLIRDRLPGVRRRLTELIRQYQPTLLVIDSFKALGTYTTSAADFRDFLHDLAATLSAFPVTSLWLGEYSHADMAISPEFAVADTIVALSTQGHRDERATRSLRVLKMRGSTFLSGGHAYRLSTDGMTVYPRLADPRDPATYERRHQRVSSGVQALDAMLADGYRTGSSTLVAGPSGIGKTLMGLHFLFGGAARGERGVLATFQEDPVQLQQMLEGFSWSLPDKNVTLLYRSPIDLYLDEWVYELLDTVERTEATRVFIDTLSDLEAATGDAQRFAEYLYSLLHRFSRRNVSTMMSYEVPELFGLSRLTDIAASNLADNVVVLQYDARTSTIRRNLTVLKTRGSAHVTDVRPFEITPQGIILADTPPDGPPTNGQGRPDSTRPSPG